MNKLIVLAVVALLSPVAAFADINITESTMTSPVEPGATVEASLEVFLNGSDAWKRTGVEIPGPNNNLCLNNPDYETDSFHWTATPSSRTESYEFSFTAPHATGTYDIVFKALESSDSDCDGGETDSVTMQLVVEEAPVVPTPAEQCELDGGTWNGDSCDFPSPEEPSEPSEPSQTSFGGGGGPCDPATGFPECQQNVAWFAWHKQVLAWQDILQKLQILIWKLEEAQN